MLPLGEPVKRPFDALAADYTASEVARAMAKQALIQGAKNSYPGVIEMAKCEPLDLPQDLTKANTC